MQPLNIATFKIFQKLLKALQSGDVNDTMLRLTQTDQQLSQMQNMTSTQSAKVLVEDSIGLLKQGDTNAALSRTTLYLTRLSYCYSNIKLITESPIFGLYQYHIQHRLSLYIEKFFGAETIFLSRISIEFFYLSTISRQK
jgi:hypothetical protein